MFNPARGTIVSYRRLLGYCGLLLALVWASCPAEGQQYTSREINEAARNIKFKAQQYARNPSGDATDFKTYIEGYAIPKLTDSRPQGLADLGKMRYELFRDFVLPSNSTVQQQLTNLLMNEMQKVATNNGGRYHPSVRYNAVLIIGMLDSTYPNDRERTPSVVLPAANGFLTTVVSKGVTDGNVPPPLVVGALVGLERHASVLGSLPAANQKATIDALVSVIEKEDFPFEAPSSVEQWIRLMAARALAATKSLGEGNRHHQALFQLIDDDAVKLNIRCQAAALLGDLKEAYGSANGLDEQKIRQSLLQLASDVAADERQRAKDYERMTIRGGYNNLTSEVDLPDPYQIRRTVLRLRGVLDALRSAGTAVKDAELKQTLDEVEQQVVATLQVAEEKDVIGLDLAQRVTTMANRVEGIASTVGVEAAEPAPAEEDEEEEGVGGAPTLSAEEAQ